MVDDLGFCLGMTDARRNLPSVYIAVCGRRDAHMPRNVQKDYEASRAWVLKDEIVGRGRVYYGKLIKGQATFLAPRTIPVFNGIWGIAKRQEKEYLSADAQKVLKILRKEWEMATADLRTDSGVTDRTTFNRALDELQAAMLVIPSEVYYVPKFTYIWTLAVGRFPEALRKRTARPVAVREIARCFLASAGATIPGELARVTGLSRPEAGLGNRALVKEGFAAMTAPGHYRLNDLDAASEPGKLLLVEGVQTRGNAHDQRNRESAHVSAAGSSSSSPRRRYRPAWAPSA
jgi:hypothetical protein